MTDVPFYLIDEPPCNCTRAPGGELVSYNPQCPTHAPGGKLVSYMPDYTPPPMKENILSTVEDLAGKFMYYDRKEDEELPVGSIEQAIADGIVTIDEIVDRFKSVISENS